MIASRFLLKRVKLSGPKILYSLPECHYPYIHLNLFRLYKEIHGHLRIPLSYVIGAKDNDRKWPTELIGFKLGNHVSYIRQTIKKSREFENTDYVQELLKLGFLVYPMKDRARRILSAFRAYIDRFETVEVPSAFKIDKSDLSWPDETRGLNLGWLLKNIRSRNTFPEIRKDLRKMGIKDIVIDHPDFERDFSALKVYKEIHGHVKMEADFEVPLNDARYAAEARGIKLGKWLVRIQKYNTYSEHRQRLIDIGVKFKSSEMNISYDVVVKTVNAFLSIFGHVNIHPAFVVPTGDERYPDVVWGVCLIPKLKALGLFKNVRHLFRVVDVSTIRPRKSLVASTTKKNITPVNFKALHIYKAVFGDLRVHDDYIIGCDDQASAWPVRMYGLRLGSHVCYIRSQLKYNLYPKDVVKRLESMGFISSVIQDYEQTLILAFKTFIEKNGHGRVLQKFTVPDDDNSWPEKTRGITLGVSLNHIRQGGLSNIKETLRSIGVEVDHVRATPDFERNFAALQVYKKIHGHANVPCMFVIPANDVRYAEEARGSGLGNWLAHIRNADGFTGQRQRLIDIGVSFEARSLVVPSEVVKSAMTTFKSVYGHSNVHPSYVVPRGDSRFAEVLWGYELGRKIRHLTVWRELREMGITNLKTGPEAVEILKA